MVGSTVEVESERRKRWHLATGVTVFTLAYAATLLVVRVWVME